MLRNPRLWLYVAGGWLLVAGAAHIALHVWGLVLEHGYGAGLRGFAMNAMKQAQSPDPLRPSLWRQFRAFSAAFGLLLVFAGGADLVLAAIPTPLRVIRAFTLFATVFWTVAFVPFALIDPVIQPMTVAIVAVPLHAIAYLTASMTEEGHGAGAAGPSR